MLNYLCINALSNLLFCVPKAAVLHGKSVGFALQNSRFRNAKTKLLFSFRIIFTKLRGIFSFLNRITRVSIGSRNSM
ncbi:hypothetical protein CUB97_10555 [Prevotella intermedia]|uniref:Uncharacterized protein n=1 Tax=Prevotella intermedia TaxID=28131 RepID=A0A2M8M3N2_PREIN|nr:hypothetical protein [Prevotella intermedia]PJE98809.1 hypothetical protein CUB97_10555 [Prevotella intermedia]